MENNGKSLMSTQDIKRVTPERIQQYLSTFSVAIEEPDRIRFTELAIKLQLDPFEREIYLTTWNKDGKIISATVIGYEVYLKRAERTGLLDGWKKGIKFMDDDGKKTTIAFIEIYRKDWKMPLYHEVYLSEYIQTRYDPKQKKQVPTKFWKEKPRTMIQKVVIAQGFRLAFPESCAGLPYTSDEMLPQYTQPTIETEYETVDDTNGDGKTETNTEEKRAKALRALINKEYSGCVVYDDIVKINTQYEKVHGKEFWGDMTHHNETETFADVAGSHINRTKSYEARHTPEAHLQWALEVNDSSNEKDFLSLLFVYQKDIGYHNDPAIHEALRDRAKEFGLWDDENQDFIIDSSAE